MAGVKEFISGEGDPIEVEEFNCISEDALSDFRDTEDGFIRVKSEDSRTISKKIYRFSVPLLSKIKDVRTEGDRDYFTIADKISISQLVDGKEVVINRTDDLKVSLSRKSDRDRASRLGYCDFQEVITIDLIKSRSEPGKAQLRIQERFYNVTNNPSLPDGKWKIYLPQSPHDLGQSYVKKMGVYWALIWFGISSVSEEGIQDDLNERYLHVGNITAGCITVLPNNAASWDNKLSKEDKGTWSSIVKTLMQYRIDNEFIGYVQSQYEK